MSSYKISFSTMAPVGKIPPGDPIWSQFNASFENVELDQVSIMDKIYTGYPFTTWHKNKWRHGNNYLAGQHLAIDFDTEDERSTISYLEKDPFIKKYAFLIYTTPSHRPEAPRARVVFLLDTPIMQAKNYTAAASALLWLFGTADRQCKDSVRFFYGSRDCDIDWRGQELPLEKVKQMIQQYQASGQLAKKVATQRNYTPTADQQEVAEALKTIPAWGIDYDEWIKVLMALHKAFGNEGLSLAESWAQGGVGEVERKWRSFNQDGNAEGTVTLNTVFKLARNNGWRGAMAA